VRGTNGNSFESSSSPYRYGQRSKSSTTSIASKRRFVYEWKVIFDGEEIGAGSNPENLASSIDFEDLWYKSHRLSSDHALSRNSTYYRISTNTSIGTKGGKNNSTSMIKQPEDWPSVSGIIETYQVSAVRNVLIVQVTTTFSRFPDGKHPPVDPPNNLQVETIVSKLSMYCRVSTMRNRTSRHKIVSFFFLHVSRNLPV
jgi:hypothetical protein